jgi:hypothetical protein
MSTGVGMGGKPTCHVLALVLWEWQVGYPVVH